MSAEIIQFGKSQQSELKSVEQRSVQRRVMFDMKSDTDKEVVRCTVDGKLYEVEFEGAAVRYVYAVFPRNFGGRIREMRRRCWFYRSDGVIDPEIVSAARRARGQSTAEITREASIAQLRERHARLMREAEKVEATIAILQRGIN